VGTDVLAGVRLQQIYESKAYELGQGEYRCPIQGAGDFLARRLTRTIPESSYPVASAGRFTRTGPPLVAEACITVCRLWTAAGRPFLRHANLVGPIAWQRPRAHPPRRHHPRNPGLTGVYPVGEGAGYAGGIVSAAVDGLRSAKAIMARYAPLAAGLRNFP